MRVRRLLDLAARLSLPLQCDPGPATNPRNRGSHLTNPAGKLRQRQHYATSARARPPATEDEVPRYAEHNLMILDQLRPREFKGGYATTYGGCLA
eukprot:COSAG06_NODE_11291_length_1532_cov_2.494068_1_plen_94_part_10